MHNVFIYVIFYAYILTYCIRGSLSGASSRLDQGCRTQSITTGDSFAAHLSMMSMSVGASRLLFGQVARKNISTLTTDASHNPLTLHVFLFIIFTFAKLALVNFDCATLAAN